MLFIWKEKEGDTLANIKKIGYFCPTDVDGYILNDSSLSKIKPEYVEVIEEVIKNYQTYLGLDLHSIYIRGSIPRGSGINGISDLDTIAVTNKKTNEIDLTWVDEVEQAINNKFNCVNGVEFSFYHIGDVLETNIFSIIPFMIKTHSVCVHGEDLIFHIPNFKADKAIGNEHLINLKILINQAKADLIDNHDKEDIKDCCVWIMKILVRAGLALIIVEESLYTRDLYPAYHLFALHFPEKEPQMRQALEYAVDPCDNPDDVLDILNQFGSWMINEAEKWLQIYNPERTKMIIS